MNQRGLLGVVGILLCGLLSGGSDSHGQKAVAQDGTVWVGRGGYAASVPADADEVVRRFESQPLYLVHPDDRPLPSNKWWTQLLVSRYARSLWTLPLKVDTNERGLEVFFPTRWNQQGSDPESEFPLQLGGKEFQPTDSRAKDWSDWAVSFRMGSGMGSGSEKYMDVTLGEGMPYVWIEYHGVQPQLRLPVDMMREARFFDLSNKDRTLPFTGDALGIAYKGRNFGLFAPDGTRFQPGNGALDVAFSAERKFLVVCPLPSAKDIATFYKFAYAVPRDTQVSWKYEPERGMVATTWKISTELLKGTEKRILQGWIPHHYRSTVHDLEFNGIEYLSPRGRLRCSVGNTFVIRFPYSGIVPNLPAPHKIGGPHDYDPARLHTYLSEIAAKPHFGDDTYWGGKDILRFGQCALMAQQTADPTYKTFRDELHKAMADWYTYTPGKKSHYFARYNRWKALVGIKPSYGSENFNDHHFHYGYFTFATALLGMHDPQFLTDYGEMARLVAKEYANWDRSDRRFPFLRTFDIWAGHSWAGGASSPGGENQESSSEAVQSWAGLIFLGQALGDKEMTDAGIMGYAMETPATLEYWFNAGGDIFPPEWKHPVTGMVWGGGKVYGTYFTGDPAWIYAIQWLPSSPMLSYLVHDRAFAAKNWQNMVQDYNAHEIAEAAKPENQAKGYQAKTASIKTFGAALGNVMLGYKLMYDPNWTAEQMDTLWKEPGDQVVHNADEITIIYYMAHSMRTLGHIDWKRRTSSPTSMVYLDDQTGTHRYIVWNPSIKSQMVEVYEGDKPIGHIQAAPQSLTETTTLLPK